jgi:peptidoglycan hydrolase-like protein with peptidoglycan-binding domain
MLTSGSADPAVHELGRQLAELGYTNSVSEGLNPYGIVDETVLQAVRDFRHDHDVLEDRQAIPGPVEEQARWIGPETWQALDAARAADTAPAPAPETAPETVPTTAGSGAYASPTSPPSSPTGDVKPGDPLT